MSCWLPMTSSISLNHANFVTPRPVLLLLASVFLYPSNNVCHLRATCFISKKNSNLQASCCATSFHVAFFFHLPIIIFLSKSFRVAGISSSIQVHYRKGPLSHAELYAQTKTNTNPSPDPNRYRSLYITWQQRPFAIAVLCNSGSLR